MLISVLTRSLPWRSRADVDAIHPGYGFLAENAEFAEKCEAAGIAFIGPDADMMRALGDKVAGRKAAIAAGVQVVPGTEEPVEKEEEALKFAKEYGYPIIIKASAGGGGRGMRVARNKKELLEGLVAAGSEAKASFGNAAVFLERYIENPKAYRGAGAGGQLRQSRPLFRPGLFGAAPPSEGGRVCPGTLPYPVPSVKSSAPLRSRLPVMSNTAMPARSSSWWTLRGITTSSR